MGRPIGIKVKDISEKYENKHRTKLLEYVQFERSIYTTKIPQVKSTDVKSERSFTQFIFAEALHCVTPDRRTHEAKFKILPKLWVSTKDIYTFTYQRDQLHHAQLLNDVWFWQEYNPFQICKNHQWM